MRVIGTAGHVDHGKSSLIASLSGTNPDRLKEEIEREMTIDLGFAWFELPDGEEIGVVDVPGHIDFIENMLSGVGGIDGTIFVIAADEGIMPQTREHLAILDLLKIPGGVIAITKVDRIDDPEWLELVEDDIRHFVRGTVLEDSLVVRTSSKTGEGLEELLSALEKYLENVSSRKNSGMPRLNIDRVFSMTGFGTVVTGTLIDGELLQGREIEILPKGIKGKIRGLQSHKKKLKMVQPGARTAVNISGVDTLMISRGNVLTYPGMYHPTRMIDVYIDLLAESSIPIKHNLNFKMFIGTDEVFARVRLLGTDLITPGNSGWLQLELSKNIVTSRGDRFILRVPSPGETIGGGVIVNPYPDQRHKRFSSIVIEKLEASRSKLEIVFQSIESNKWGTIKNLVDITHIDFQNIVPEIECLIEDDRVFVFNNGEINEKSIFISKNEWELAKKKTVTLLDDFHRENPIKFGMQREELKSKLKLDTKIFSLMITNWVDIQIIKQSESYIGLFDHEIKLSLEQKEKINKLFNVFNEQKYSPPSGKECVEIVGSDLFKYILSQNELIHISEDIVYKKDIFEEIQILLTNYLQKNITITVAEFRDLINSSRRYALALLEYFDSIGFTIRDGDIRKLKNRKNCVKAK